MDNTGYNKVKDIRDTAAVLHISRDISLMRFPKGNNVISAFQQCKMSNTATSCLHMSGTLKKKDTRTGRLKTDVLSMKKRRLMLSWCSLKSRHWSEVLNLPPQ